MHLTFYMAFITWVVVVHWPGGHTTQITFVRKFQSKFFNLQCLILVHYHRFVKMFEKLAHFQTVLAWNYFYHVGSMLTAVSIHPQPARVNGASVTRSRYGKVRNVKIIINSSQNSENVIDLQQGS